MTQEIDTDKPPVCDYEGSDYQTRFWEDADRAYEDAAEEIALKRLLPKQGKLMLEIGAGAGRNTPRYKGYERIVLMDYSTTQLQQAQERLGKGDEYIYVAANVYKLPFVPGLFDGATMIRVLHHIADVPKAFAEIRKVLQSKAIFILEFANKRNLKSILRYLVRQQKWNPFTPEQVEFVELNYDFHPRTVRVQLTDANFKVGRQLSVSYFRLGLFKRLIPHKLLVFLDSILQPTAAVAQYAPSIFTHNISVGDTPAAAPNTFFACPECGDAISEDDNGILASGCGLKWGKKDGIYNFKQPIE